VHLGALGRAELSSPSMTQRILGTPARSIFPSAVMMPLSSQQASVVLLSQ
jgi:hypothetical protein